MFESLLMTVIAMLVTTATGYITQSLFRKQKELAEQSRQVAVEVAKAVKGQESAIKAARTEALLEKLPSGLSPDEFLSKLEDTLSRIPTEPSAPTATESAVELLINSYHEQALGQSSVQFWFSVVAATIGFIWILYSASVVDPKDLIQLMNVLPGVAMDAAAFLFFRQATQTRERATQLYDRLRTDKQMTESISVVTSIEHKEIKSAVQAQIALHMSGISTAPLDLNRFLCMMPLPIDE